jgi:adenylate cyclase
MVTRRLAAVLALDAVGYSAMMARAEEQTHKRIGAEIGRMTREIERSHGRVFSIAGDGLMAEFPSSIGAVKCALRLQAEAARRNAKSPADERIFFRIGINSGEVIAEGGRVGGTTVNIAARLESLAEAGGVYLSATVYEVVRRTVAVAYESVGHKRLKNIRDPVSIYSIPAEACSAWSGMPALPREGAPGATGMQALADYRASLAVVPFRTLQRDQTDAYFAEGIVDDIIRLLSGLNDLLVVSRSSTLNFARVPIDIREVAHELNVRYVLHGGVQRSGEALRIAVELSEAPPGTVIWADRFDGQVSDLFSLQDRIAVQVATTIAPQLRERELNRALRKHPESMTAYDLTLQALDLFGRMDRNSLARANRLLEQAIAHDAGYAPAYSYKASFLAQWIGQGWSKDELADRVASAEAARMAIERDPNDAVALAIYGHVQSYLMKDYKVGQELLERAVTAGPSCAWAWGYSSLTLGYLGDCAAAIARAERAVRLSPIGPDSFWWEHFLSQAYYLSGRFRDAIDWGRLSAAHAPANASNLRCLSASLVAAGEITEAKRLAAQLMSYVPTFGLSSFRERTPLRGEVRETFIDLLRQAGLPD